jgi:SAM-dependent methyltransferase
MTSFSPQPFNEKYPYGFFTFARSEDFENLTVNDYDAIAGAFDDIMGIDFHAATYGIRRAQIEKQIGARPFRSLDLCCGTGIFLEQITKDFPVEGYGIDLSKGQLDIAQQRLAGRKVTLRIGDVTQTEFPADLDLVTMNMDALNHLTSPTQWDIVFEKTFAALKRGGLFSFDINLPKRLLNDWNNIEYVGKPHVHYIQLAEKPEPKDGFIWRRTPMVVFKQQDNGLFAIHRAVIRQMAVPLDKVDTMLKERGFQKVYWQYAPEKPEGHIFNKNRAFVFAIK